MRKIKKKQVNRREYKDYWEKSSALFRTMGKLHIEGDSDSTALQGIHAAILAADAVLIFASGFKSSADNHEDAATLISNLSLDESGQAARHLSKILSVKSLVEYSGDRYTAKEASEIVKQVERFFNWVRKVLPP